MRTYLPILLAALVATSSRAEQTTSDPVFERCIVKVKDEVEIPAQKDGVLMELPVIEGSQVKAKEKLAVVDDREAKAAVRAAQAGLRAAEERVKDDIEEQYAVAARDVAKIDLKKSQEANQRTPGSVPDIEVIQKELVVQKSDLQIEKAQKDRVMASLEADTKRAELEAAQVGLVKRVILAPFDGEVVKLYREKSEWVNPGDPILTLMRFDVLHVEAQVPARLYDRNELQGREVTVAIPRARGREIALPGKVVHVGQLIESGGNYLVRAEVENAKEGGFWVVQPGMGQRAKMTIHLR
ncbi:efflux RND transporter periplasmic adaptor subunit [Bythopirellula polymerisocia]|uniref:Multidrug resistance protein MdtN n=1 Tax=Bythopirellula polymerisocia TaxID=2528003 RepID=A0A5C6D102_9BACT|nr:HlyD family efflux transporter periplasmic adaptor subunit [Bythopirellula polymerisocia]TWU30408.1 multidrug resistance protein MdtN [Bythopirellula polymerisocia]